MLYRPILNIEPVGLDGNGREIVQNLDLYDHIIFISTNAVVHGLRPLADRWPQWPVNLKWYAVGDSTAAQLKMAGIDPLVPVEFSSEGLLALPELTQVESQRVLIVRGQGGRETLKETLIKRNAIVDYLEVYQRFENEWPDGIVNEQEIPRLLASVVYSADSLTAFDLIVDEAVRDVPLIVPSEKVKKLALSKGYMTVLSSRPKDEAVVEQIRALQALLKHSENIT